MTAGSDPSKHAASQNLTAPSAVAEYVAAEWRKDWPFNHRHIAKLCAEGKSQEAQLLFADAAFLDPDWIATKLDGFARRYGNRDYASNRWAKDDRELERLFEWGRVRFQSQGLRWMGVHLAKVAEPAASSPVCLYHGTSLQQLPGILEKGLVPRGGIGSDEWARKHEISSIVDASADKRPASLFVGKDSEVCRTYAEKAAEMNGWSRPLILTFSVPAEIATALKADELADDAERYEGVFQPAWITEITALPRR